MTSSEQFHLFVLLLTDLIAFFTLYSFFGWIVEAIFRSFKQRRFVNPGFLFGPFVPIYGFGSVGAILLHSQLSDSNFLLQTLTYGVSISGMEYMTGVIIEGVLGVTLWDYSDNKLNLGGKICLKYSFLWTAMVLLLVFIIHPFADESLISLLDGTTRSILAVTLGIYFLIDFTASVTDIATFKRRVLYFRNQFLFADNKKIQNIFVSFRRLLDAFPRLCIYLQNQIIDGIRNHVGSLLTTVGESPRRTRKEERENDTEYLMLINDIVQHIDIQRLDDSWHHDNSILGHVETVSYLSYRICKRLNLDYKSAARGSLLYNLSLYDRRDNQSSDLPKKKTHRLEHSRIALYNAKRQFILNNVECDIILKHMWPLTLVPPKYKESYIVILVDKYVASRKFINRIGK